MTGVNGKDVLISVDDGAGTMLEIEYQGDATFNSGKTQNIKRQKNGSLPYQSEAGATISFSFGKTRPLSAGQSRLYALSDSNESASFEYNAGQNSCGVDAQKSLGDQPRCTVAKANVSAIQSRSDL